MDTSVEEETDKGLRTLRSNNRASLPAPRSTNKPTSAVSEKLEKTLARRESELKRKIDKLNDEIAAASKREEEATKIIKERDDRTRSTAYEQLENNFTCALCYDIMACPWSLNHPACGHTFCAECILKWFFSGMHRACGTWHASLDCPICRSTLTHPRPTPPRPVLTFPFSPNRVADAALKDLIAVVAGKEKPKAKKKVRSLTKPGVTLPWEAWLLGGSAHTEWLARDDRGRFMVNEVAKGWQTMDYDLLVITKETLGV
ncbi:hypothetical protein NEOLEDRAFT_1060052 [Neolentinus lepideus HHB14362 ss-1]|uniref:RING-type domain-containing protein n=1 Tax=Neolentinus lepideus HHB14362 ss-1 TaxID=1314782 RepID=A0A165UBX6_9AGAM|nr:hypothetical protein NEOLEDRAFT_1060052 [Neolentinus lepideus HHB14362 ss-1]